MSPRSLLALFACSLLAAAGRAADPTPADLDRAAVEVLKDLHNRGADLYNSADATGALRVYETALRAVTPFLAHRPAVQAAIADGLAEAARLDGHKAQAFRLHELIDQVRTDLKAAAKSDAVAKPDPKPERKPDPSPDTPKADPKRGPEPDPKPAEPKPTEPKKPDPKPAEPKKPDPPAVGAVRGVVTLDGTPVSGATVTLTPLAWPHGREVTAAADADGTFAVADLRPGVYAVAVAGGGKAVPAKYQSAKTSGLVLVVKGGSQAGYVTLQSK